MTGEPRVTVVIPVRNEEDRIAACLDALAAQDLAPELVELLVVDGGSDDASVSVARNRLAAGPWGRATVLQSPVGDRASNLNCGLEHASAPVFVRVDARSRVPRQYLRRCLELLESRPDVAVVGGRQRAVASGLGPVGVGVARALNNRWATGLARYRRSQASGPTDTVYLGAYRTEQLRAAGGWRTELEVNEDFDLNRRLRAVGTVWFDRDLAVDYLPRASFRALLAQYWRFGMGKATYWRVSRDRPRPRQIVALAALPVGLAALATVWASLGAVAAALVVVAGSAIGLGVEALGADGPRGGIRAHLAAMLALTGVAVAWVTGIVVAFLLAPPAHAPRAPRPGVQSGA